jgi:hypothetical protein
MTETKIEKIKNKKISAFGKKRIGYCSLHQRQSEQHRVADCCDKSQGVKAYSRCPQFRELMRAIKACGDCQNPQFFQSILRRQINCEQVIDLLVNKPEENKENLICLLFRDDNTCSKKLLNAK